MNYPPISCKTITYGRVEMLEEALEGFLRQDYPGKKELIIVNDCPFQHLIFDHPEVKIINVDSTFKTIGEKENFAFSQCDYDIIVQFDDDDIALPNHLRNVAKYFTEGSDLLHWQNAIFMNMPKIESLICVGNSGIVYSRKAYELVGGYPLENAGYDMTFVIAIKTLSKNVIFADPPDDEVSWIYVWGGRGYHMSGMGTDDDTRPNVVLRHSAYIESLRVKGLVPVGGISLRPNWKYNYPQMLKDFLKK